MEILWYDEFLTQKQVELYVAIKEFIEEKKYSPSVRELCNILNKKSTGTIDAGLKLLKRKGYIDFEVGKNRTLQITKDVKYEKH